MFKLGVNSKMKAGVLHAREDLRYEEIPKPSPQAGQVLIKVKYTGICGSDLPRVNGDASHFYPNILGHEFAGTIAEIGEGVQSLKVGDRVAGVPLIPCLKCEDCQKGDYSLCKHYSFVGSRQNGSFAEYVVVPEKNAVKFDESISFEQGAFFEPATVALHGLNRLDFKGGSTVAVLGGGNIGLFTMQWAKIFGAKKVVVFDINDERLQLAKRFGADECLNTLNEGFMEDAELLTNGKGFDYVYETAGNTVTMKMAFELVVNKGGVCLIGTPTKEISFTVDEWEKLNRKEFNLTGSWMSYSPAFPGKEWELTANYFKTGELRFDDSFIFKKIPLSEIADAFELYKTPDSVKAKILIDSEK
jgi:L-iditol 2-dehydrogenase